MFSQPYYNQKVGKRGIFDWMAEKYNQINNLGNGSHIAVTDYDNDDTVNINLVIYKYTAIINKDPDYVLKYHKGNSVKQQSCKLISSFIIQLSRIIHDL